MGWGRFGFGVGCARAGEIFYFLFFSHRLCTIPFKKKKKAAHSKPDARADPMMLLPQIPTLGWTALKISGARARDFFYISMLYHTIARKKKVATGKSGARADPHHHITDRFPYHNNLPLWSSSCAPVAKTHQNIQQTAVLLCTLIDGRTGRPPAAATAKY